jgi:hypothetical protein
VGEGKSEGREEGGEEEEFGVGGVGVGVGGIDCNSGVLRIIWEWMVARRHIGVEFLGCDEGVVGAHFVWWEMRIPSRDSTGNRGVGG